MRPFLFILALFFLSAFPHAVLAVPSPDLIISIGTIAIQWITIGLVFVVGIFSASYRFLRHLFYRSKLQFFGLILGFPLLIFGMIFGGILLYQRNEQRNLVLELQQQDMLLEQHQDESDKLQFSPEQTIAEKGGERFQTKFDSTEAGAQLIQQYYKDIAYGKLDEAYDLSHHKVSKSVFVQWYGKVSKISIDKLTKIDEQSYSLELVLCESNGDCGRYGVLMTLVKEGDQFTRIANSQVRSLQFNEQKQLQIQEKESSLSNVELQRIIDSGEVSKMIVLDARENVEYENGRFPNSVHIRMADLRAGKWLDLDSDKAVIVLCWSGIRGKEVAEFLRSKQINARYVENGAQGWVDSGGLWEGGISIKTAYPDRRYSRLFTCDEMKEEMGNGTFVVDSREPFRYAQFHIQGSVSIPILYTPSSNLEEVFAQVPRGSKVISVCNGYVNCFDARVTGIELEKRGYDFLGRFTSLSCFR